MGAIDINKLIFIEKVLGNWSNSLDAKLLNNARAMNLYDSKTKNHPLAHLQDTFSHTVKGNDANAQGTAEFSFAEWGRMLDMGKGRMKKIESHYTNSLLLQTKNVKKARQPKKFYSKTAYGMLNRLMYELSQTYIESVSYTLKTELQAE